MVEGFADESAWPRTPEPEYMRRSREKERELEVLGERLAELSAYIQAATYRLLVLLRKFDERKVYGASCLRRLIARAPPLSARAIQPSIAVFLSRRGQKSRCSW